MFDTFQKAQTGLPRIILSLSLSLSLTHTHHLAYSTGRKKHVACTVGPTHRASIVLSVKLWRPQAESLPLGAVCPRAVHKSGVPLTLLWFFASEDQKYTDSKGESSDVLAIEQ